MGGVAAYDIPDGLIDSKLSGVVKVACTLATKLQMIACPKVYEDHIVLEYCQVVIYPLLAPALYGCLKSALEFLKHLSGNKYSTATFYSYNAHPRQANKWTDHNLK